MTALKRHCFLALTALLLVLVARDLAWEFRVWAGAPGDWMVVRAVEIPDHAAGEDPMIVYDRSVLQPFRAEWVVEVRPVMTSATPRAVSSERPEVKAPPPICSGSGVNEYAPQERLTAVPLYRWYMGRDPCVLPPGRYVAKTVWRTADGIVIRNTSNVFTVSGGANGGRNEGA